MGSQIDDNYNSLTWREQRHRLKLWLLQQPGILADRDDASVFYVSIRADS